VVFIVPGPGSSSVSTPVPPSEAISGILKIYRRRRCSSQIREGEERPGRAWRPCGIRGRPAHTPGWAGSAGRTRARRAGTRFALARAPTGPPSTRACRPPPRCRLRPTAPPPSVTRPSPQAPAGRIDARTHGPVFLAGRRPRRPVASIDLDPATGRARLSYRRARRVLHRHHRLDAPPAAPHSDPGAERQRLPATRTAKITGHWSLRTLTEHYPGPSPGSADVVRRHRPSCPEPTPRLSCLPRFSPLSKEGGSPP
jgi:hypothetical protein